ncbi:hypothetical protein PUN28_013555 [Cardiocondyla obscurior]|uniref:Uncharacterized protein n=1 Tax=Cardiocondyla obscurior TaxID=286306 RepID=A0AAW2F736_9HYME
MLQPPPEFFNSAEVSRLRALEKNRRLRNCVILIFHNTLLSADFFR